MLARYNSTCGECGENIVANMDVIEKKGGKWIHRRCTKDEACKKKEISSDTDEIFLDEKCLGCETGADYDGAHLNENGEYFNGCDMKQMKNYCFECGEEISITRQLCGKLYCINS